MQALLREVDGAAPWLQQAARNTRIEPVLMFKLAAVWRDVRDIEDDLVQTRNTVLTHYATHPTPTGVQFDSLADVPLYETEMRAVLAAEVDLPHVRGKLPYDLFKASNDAISDEAERIPFSAETIALTDWLIEYPADWLDT